MFNNGEGGCGNDLAIDDIIFRSCGDLTEISDTETGNNGLDICEPDAPVSLDLLATPDFSVYEQHAYQWQESGDNENWQDIPGETSEEFSTPQISTTRYYRVKVAEDEVNLNNNFCNSASESFEVKIIETPSAPKSSGNIEICSNEEIPPLHVAAEEDETVNWYASESGGDPLAENTFAFTPKAAGIYYAEAVKTGFECSGSERTPVGLKILKALKSGMKIYRFVKIPS